MQEQLLADIEAGELFDRAALAGHCDMSHAFARLVAEACCDQLVVAPHRAIEEDQGRAGKPRLEIVSYIRAGGEKFRILSGM